MEDEVTFDELTEDDVYFGMQAVMTGCISVLGRLVDMPADRVSARLLTTVMKGETRSMARVLQTEEHLDRLLCYLITRGVLVKEEDGSVVPCPGGEQ